MQVLLTAVTKDTHRAMSSFVVSFFVVYWLFGGLYGSPGIKGRSNEYVAYENSGGGM